MYAQVRARQASRRNLGVINPNLELVSLRTGKADSGFLCQRAQHKAVTTCIATSRATAHLQQQTLIRCTKPPAEARTTRRPSEAHKHLTIGLRKATPVDTCLSARQHGGPRRRHNGRVMSRRAGGNAASNASDGAAPPPFLIKTCVADSVSDCCSFDAYLPCVHLRI